MYNPTLNFGNWAKKGFKQPIETINKRVEKLKGHHRGGWKFSKEIKRKMSLLAKEKGFGKWMLGKKHTEETKLKMSLAQCGDKGSNWKGGVTKDRERKNRLHNEYRHRVGLRKKYQHGLSGTKEYKRLQKQRRKAVERNGGKLSVKTIQLVYEDNIKYFGTLTCYLCLNPIEFGQDSLEHKTPLSRKGTNEYNNLAIAHQSCNKKKHNKTPEEYKIYATKSI